jgi:hypothetical protein
MYSSAWPSVLSPKRSAVVTTFNVGQLVLLHVVHTKLQNLSRPCDDFKLVVLIVVPDPMELRCLVPVDDRLSSES